MSSKFSSQAGRLAFVISALHIAGVTCLLSAGRSPVVLFGIAGLSYLLGLRHAFDIDHVATIDNVTRAMVRHGRQPVFVGFWFSLGHATVVFALSLAVIAGVVGTTSGLGAIATTGTWIGTTISAMFLTLLVITNFGLLRDLGRDRATTNNDGEASSTPLRGVFSRVTQRGTCAINASWKMYPVGLLFGLGFDTATEIALLGLSAMAAAQSGLSVVTLLALPLLFAAGMTLFDSVNGVLMLRSYRWASADGRSRTGLNLTITTLSVVVAASVAGLEWVEIGVNVAAPHGVVAAWIAALPSALWGAGVLVLGLVIWTIGALWYARRANIQQPVKMRDSA